MTRKEPEFFQQQNNHWKKCKSVAAAVVVAVVVVAVVVVVLVVLAVQLKACKLLWLFVPIYQIRKFMDHCVHQCTFD
jgi:phosphatidylserine synthase